MIGHLEFTFGCDGQNASDRKRSPEQSAIPFAEKFVLRQLATRRLLYTQSLSP